MKRNLTVLTTAVALGLLAAPASADRGLGVGAVTTLTGAGGITLTYDAEIFHIDGIFGLIDVGDADLALGARGFYTVHSRAGADLSLGGGLILVNEGGNDDTDFHFELGAKVRVFIVPNVALHATIGLGLIIDDDDGGNDDDELVLDGLTMGDFGFTYFFQ